MRIDRSSSGPEEVLYNFYQFTMWAFRSIILALAIALTNTLPLDNLSPLPELENGGVHWAVIVAGSNGWYNYRHQADICHAYQILHKNGIPDERIVVMMYDDIAFNKENPHKGVVINHLHGQNLYKGVPKDYTGSAVTPSVFLKVLQGEKAGLDEVGSGKVINSGPNDHIFVFFADHGAPGLIAFPDSYLYASKFLSALKNMYNEKKYAKMLIYIEACESGSMFKDLPKDINIFGETAANGNEPSYACYYDSELETYLGDVFSVTWMENSDKVSLKRTTVLEQYDMVKKQVNTSHVQKFGDMSIGKMKLSDFQSSESALQTPGDNSAIPSAMFDFSNSVHSRQVALMILRKKWEKARTQEEKEDIERNLSEYYAERNLIRHIFHDIVESITQENELAERLLNTSEEITDTECYEEAVDHFLHACSPYRHSEHVLGYLKSFVNLCNERFYIGHITDTINRVCSHHTQL